MVRTWATLDKKHRPVCSWNCPSLMWPEHKGQASPGRKNCKSKQALMKPQSTHKGSWQQNQVRQFWLQVGVIVSAKPLNPQSRALNSGRALGMRWTGRRMWSLVSSDARNTASIQLYWNQEQSAKCRRLTNFSLFRQIKHPGCSSRLTPTVEFTQQDPNAFPARCSVSSACTWFI